MTKSGGFSTVSVTITAVEENTIGLALIAPRRYSSQSGNKWQKVKHFYLILVKAQPIWVLGFPKGSNSIVRSDTLKHRNGFISDSNSLVDCKF